MTYSSRPLHPSGAPPRSGEDSGRPVHRTVGASKQAIDRARTLRQTMSLPEVLLWQQLQKRPGGFKFRKQFPAPPYTIDFACLSARLCIEVDGEAHNCGDQPSRDAARDEFMARRGFQTLRLAAGDVLNNMEGCIALIAETCQSSPERGGGAAQP